jgi:hypothetical protein
MVKQPLLLSKEDRGPSDFAKDAAARGCTLVVFLLSPACRISEGLAVNSPDRLGDRAEVRMQPG